MAEAALKVRLIDALIAKEKQGQRALPPATPAEPVYPGAKLSTARLARLAEHIVGEAFAIEELFLRGKQRGARRLAHGRTLAMGLVHLVAGRSQEDVATTFKRNRTTASNHMEMIEWLNDCPEHDAFWTLLCLRFERLVELADMPSPRTAWLAALDGLVRAVRNEELQDDEALNQARHVVGVFWEERTRG
jgi:hypothetical protein